MVLFNSQNPSLGKGWIADRRIVISSDRERLLDPTEEQTGLQLAAPGTFVSEADCKRYGLGPYEGKAETPEEAAQRFPDEADYPRTASGSRTEAVVPGEGQIGHPDSIKRGKMLSEAADRDDLPPNPSIRQMELRGIKGQKASEEEEADSSAEPEVDLTSGEISTEGTDSGEGERRRSRR